MPYLETPLVRPKVVPLAPSSRGVAPPPNPQFQQEQNALANKKFSQYYGGLSPDELTQFTPATDTLSINGTNAHSLALANPVAPRSADELAAAQRQNARSHFEANVLPYDQDYADMKVRHAAAGVGSLPSIVPLAPTPGTRTTDTYKDPDTGHTITTVTGTNTPPKPGKPIGDQVAGVIKAGGDAINKFGTQWTSAARTAETARHNKELEDQARARIANTADRGTTQTDARAKQQQLYAEELKAKYGVPDEKINAILGLGPATQPAPTTQPASQQPPAGRGAGAVAPATPPPANRGGMAMAPAIPPGHVAFDPKEEYPNGTTGFDTQNRPIVFDGKKWQLAGPNP